MAGTLVRGSRGRLALERPLALGRTAWFSGLPSLSFRRVGSATLEARQPEVVVAKSRRGSYQPPIPRPTQVGGSRSECAVPSPRGADPVPLAQVRFRPAGRAPAVRSDAGSAGR